jgi:4-hydroxy-3-polyprenylbenzoate decarboxylase
MKAEAATTKSQGDYKGLREYLELLESAGLLHRIKAEVDLNHEIGAIAAWSLERKGPALLLEHAKGYAVSRW